VDLDAAAHAAVGARRARQHAIARSHTGNSRHTLFSVVSDEVIGK
jgi:hypothetical protein